MFYFQRTKRFRYFNRSPEDDLKYLKKNLTFLCESIFKIN